MTLAYPPGRILAILAGASHFQSPTFEDAPAFAHCSTAIGEYLTDPGFLAIHADDTLILFDQPDAVGQYKQIQTFLSERLTVHQAEDGQGILVLFVYVGHGGFFGNRGDYCLVTTDTRAPLEAETSIRVATLASVLTSSAPRSSYLLILDCCFAAEATSLFQSPLDEVVGRHADEVADSRRVTLLCASSARRHTVMDSRTSTTVFGWHLIRVLRHGEPTVRGPLSVNDVCAAIRRRAARSSDPARQIYPEVHSPRQAGRDLADIGIFHNPARPTPTEMPPVTSEDHDIRVELSQVHTALRLAAGGISARLVNACAEKELRRIRQRHQMLPGELVLAVVQQSQEPPREPETPTSNPILNLAAQAATIGWYLLNAYTFDHPEIVFTTWGMRVASGRITSPRWKNVYAIRYEDLARLTLCVEHRDTLTTRLTGKREPAAATLAGDDTTYPLPINLTTIDTWRTLLESLKLAVR
ncbi:caspase family protein [Plantactinospora veratri]|uniref:Caspase family protein n=1 Tax=Plantactinospora veratri TaxID=1436122 RepID=A0ABU7SQ46_9ACTN